MNLSNQTAFCNNCLIMVTLNEQTNFTLNDPHNVTNFIDGIDIPVESKYKVYILCNCPNCMSLFLIEENYTLYGEEFTAYMGANLLYPPDNEFKYANLPSILKQYYLEFNKNQRIGSTNSAAMMGRKCIEYICASHDVNENTLYKSLEKLHEKKILDGRVIELAHMVRLLGNEAAHSFDNKITKSDLKDLNLLLEVIFLNVYVITKSYEKLKKKFDSGK